MRKEDKDFTPNFRDLEIEIMKAYYMEIGNAWQYENVLDPFTKIYFVKRGKGFLKQGETYLPIEDGHVYIIPAGCEVTCGCEYMEKVWMHVRMNGTEKYDLLSKFKTIAALPFPIADFQFLLSLLESKNLMDYYYVKLLVGNIILDFAKAVNPPLMISAKEYSPMILSALLYIRDNIRITLTTKEIAENLFVSVSLLRRTFQKELGRTIGEYVDEMVFSEAKKLLSDSFVSVTEVSRRLCFGSRTYFTHRFKEIYGMTPTEYRRIALVLTE